jgi:hypothetical protein
LTGRNLKH